MEGTCWITHLGATAIASSCGPLLSTSRHMPAWIPVPETRCVGSWKKCWGLSGIENSFHPRLFDLKCLWWVTWWFFCSGKLVRLSLGGCPFGSAPHVLMVKRAKIRDMKHPFSGRVSFMVAAWDFANAKSFSPCRFSLLAGSSVGWV